MEAVEVEECTAASLSALLEGGAGAVVTLVAGETSVAVHRAVLAARCPALATLADAGGQVAVRDVKGVMLLELVAYCYSLQVPQLPDAAPRLLAAAHRFRLPALQAECERQMAARLAVDNAAAAAALAVRHSCTHLKEAAVAFLRANLTQVMATRGWADALHSQPGEMAEVSRLLSEHPVGTGFLATGDRFQYVHYNLRVGATTVGKIVADTCASIWEVLSPLYMMTEPTPEKWTSVAERFEDLWNFPNCCGAVDGKHIRIEGPWNCGSAYYNYKNFHSIVLQAVVDAEGNFLIVDVGAPGRNNDAGVFLSSSFGQRFVDKSLNLPASRLLYPNKNVSFPYVFVADDAYSLAINMMKPFPRSALLSNDRKIYNYRLCRARRLVECAFGMMVKKFRVLEQAMLVHPDVTKQIVLACCVLHNFIRKREGKLAEVYDELMHFVEVDEEPQQAGTRASKAAYKVRESYVQFFNSPTGAVSWQDRMAFCN